jgi:drug/metabolite transporter (DMT)-like permease
LSYIIPLTTAISYVIIFIASVFFLKETLGALQIAGYFIIMLGVILINVK